MPEESVETFEIPFLRILDDDGNCDEMLKPNLGEDQIREIFELMVLSRTFDEVALKLQREGRIGTFASAKGQEATQVGSAYALRSEDWLFPSFRENAAYIARGMPIGLLFEYWGGDERGNKIPDNVNAFTVAIPVATQIPHAVGFAWGAKLRKDKRAVLVYFGDGATSEGDFHEGMNFAGIFKLPVIFLCENNQWAISLPRARQCAAKTLAQKALGYGFEGVQVDGNDVFAVYKATKKALEKAYEGNGPTLIECVTYRVSDHTTSDDASRYRDPKELEGWIRKDPIDRLRRYMKRVGIWSEEYEKNAEANASDKVRKAVEEAESLQPQLPTEMFIWAFKDMTPRLKEEFESLSGGK
jgi:pyruvate dehydrogenase E1 component alpha subunit